MLLILIFIVFFVFKFVLEGWVVWNILIILFVFLFILVIWRDILLVLKRVFVDLILVLINFLLFEFVGKVIVLLYFEVMLWFFGFRKLEFW